MFDYNQLQALRELVVGEEEQQDVVENHCKGSVLTPGDIGGDGKKKEVAKPFAKVEAKVGKKYEPSVVVETKPEKPPAKKQVAGKKNEIWTEQEITDLPVSRNDKRKTPEFEVRYRQKVGTEDVFLGKAAIKQGLSGVDPSSANCQEMLYRIELPNTTMKQISLDITEKAMVLQTKDFYLYEHFQYRAESKQVKAKFISDKYQLQLVVPVIRDFPS